MPKFIFTYRAPTGYVTGDADNMDAWQAWFGQLGDHVAEIGNPVSDRTTVGLTPWEHQLGGFSIITADDLEAAAVLAKGCPFLKEGGGVEVGQLQEM